MIASVQPFPSEEDLAYLSAVENDAAVQCRILGFDDRFGSKRLSDLVHEAYVFEFMVIAQVVRWYSIGLLVPGEISLVHPSLLMEDLRRRLRLSPHEYIRSPAMDATIVRMAAWWQTHTITSAWRHIQAHVRTQGEAPELADALADFLWGSRHHFTAKGGTE